MTPRRRGPGPRQRKVRGRSLVGECYDVEVGGVAHGGHFVARLPEDALEVGGTVVFVRHALPGEVVTVRVTEGQVGDRFVRGDAVEVHRASADRVPPPCSHAGPGLCGGCDFQHVRLDGQRRLKGEVVREQLVRLAGLDLDVQVEPVPGDDRGLRWRTRMRYHRTRSGILGLRAHRSSAVVDIDDCLIQAPGARVTVEDEAVGGTGAAADADAVVVERVRDRSFEVAADGFWQVHVGAPETLVSAVLAAARVRPGDRVVDLYSGVGLFTVFLAEAVGAEGHVTAVEADRRAAEHATTNLAAYPWVEARTDTADRALAGLAGNHWDVVVLDPPREGARRPVVEGIAALGPRTVVHVACDPASFARDTALLAEHGYVLSSLRAFDLFPMTQHVEVVGTFDRPDTRSVQGQGGDAGGDQLSEEEHGR